MVVIPGIEGDAVFRAGFDDAADGIEGAVAVERRDLDRHHVVERGEPAPEGGPEHDSAHRGLQIEADQRNPPGEPRAMGDPLVLAGAREGGEAHQPGVIAEAEGDIGFRESLFRPPDEARDPHQRPVGPGLGGLGGDPEHRLVEAGLADRELGRVHADREAAGAGVEIVAGERALAPLVEPAAGIEGQRMGRDHDAAGERRSNRLRNLAPGEAHGTAGAENTPSRTSYRVGLARLGMSRATQSAVHSIISPSGTPG